jgi:hypothetical protein
MFPHPGLLHKRNAEKVPIVMFLAQSPVKTVRPETIVPIRAWTSSISVLLELFLAGAQVPVRTVPLGRSPVKRGPVHAAPVVPTFTL